jgi:hypothetical protein
MAKWGLTVDDPALDLRSGHFVAMLLLARRTGPDRYFGSRDRRAREGGFCARAARRPSLQRRRQRLSARYILKDTYGIPSRCRRARFARLQVVQPATEEYPEEREERVCLCCEDRVELEERVKVEDGRVGQRSGDRVECDTLCRRRCGV